MTAAAATATSEVAAPPATPSIQSLIEGKGDAPWVAFEFFPPKTETGVANLYARLEKLKARAPLYIDFTWGAGGSTSDLTLELTQTAQDKFGYIANMHLTCTNMPREKLDTALATAKKVGIKNILALRGDPPVGQTDFQKVETGFACALDLVKFIRAESGDEFCVSVAGYPEGHPDSIKEVIAGQSLTPSELARSVKMDDGTVHVCSDADFEKELAYLKAKVDAGANMIVTQMFYDVNVFLTFVAECKRVGINVPIIPGIMCITSYNGFKRMCSFCKTRVPPGMGEKMEELKEDQEAVEKYAIQWGVDTCKTLLANGHNGLHFYTLNLDKIMLPIMDALGI